MRKFIVVAAALISASSWAQAPALNCDIGPAHKAFGGSPWLVYGCNDGHSVVVVTAQGSPAMPFYFTFSYGSGAYRLVGEGTGSKAATDAAYQELSRLKTAQIQQLYSEAASKEGQK